MEDEKTTIPKNRPLNLKPLYLTALGVSLGLTSLYLYRQFSNPVNTQTNTQAVIKSGTILPLPSGPQIYRFTHGKSVTGPKIQTAQVSHLTPQANEEQIVTLTIKHDSPIKSVTANLVTDNKSKTYTFKKISGTDTDGAWEASWKINDTYDYQYYLDFTLTSDTGDFHGPLTFRK